MKVIIKKKTLGKYKKGTEYDVPEKLAKFLVEKSKVAEYPVIVPVAKKVVEVKLEKAVNNSGRRGKKIKEVESKEEIKDEEVVISEIETTTDDVEKEEVDEVKEETLTDL